MSTVEGTFYLFYTFHLYHHSTLIAETHGGALLLDYMPFIVQKRSREALLLVDIFIYRSKLQLCLSPFVRYNFFEKSRIKNKIVYYRRKEWIIKVKIGKGKFL